MQSQSRTQSIDIVRGIVMILMAVDHVRVYAAVPAFGTSPGVFFTRWITHFVAPAFAFLMGTSMYLRGRENLSRFLLTRGAWLVVLELTVIRVAWTFSFDFAHYELAGVIWMLGICMILMAAVVHLPMRAIAAIGIAIVALHNITNFIVPENFEPNAFLRFLYFGGPGVGPIFVLYVIVPWIGVVMCGYAYGAVMSGKLALRLGVALTLLFVVLRAINLYGDPRPWSHEHPLSFIATTKYPASLDFLLMTLGPMFLALAFFDRRTNRVLSTYGRVPMFYYLLHIPLIHVMACIVSLIREGKVNPWLIGHFPSQPSPAPPGYMWSLGLLYAVFAICVALLYLPCRWYADLRATKRYRWLSYI